jgi:hypothetical protein
MIWVVFIYFFYWEICLKRVVKFRKISANENYCAPAPETMQSARSMPKFGI